MLRSSFRLGRVAGIPVSANWSVLVIGSLITWSLAGSFLPAAVPDIHPVTAWCLAILGAGAFFASLLAHEVGHAVTARRAGVGTDEITLWLFGGVAKLTSQAGTARDELRIAAAGPLVSIGLALVFAAAAGLGSILDVHPALIVLAAWMALINGSLGLFNLLPGIPLDGGRILRAWRWKRTGDPLRATRTAARAGRIVGGGLAALGAVQLVTLGGGLWTMFIGWFLYQSATMEERQAIATSALHRLTVRDVTDAHVPVVDHLLTLDHIAHEVMPRTGRLAVVLHDADDRIVGVVDAERLAAQRPTTWALTPAWQVARPAGGPQGVPFAHPNQQLADVLEDGGEPSHLLVFEDGRFVGLVTPAQVAGRLSTEVTGLRPPAPPNPLPESPVSSWQDASGRKPS